MGSTPFPATPPDVVALTVREFMRELDVHESVSIDAFCQRFLGDANRAVVWFIRVRALNAWCERSEIAAWLRSDPAYVHHAGEVAAGFALNHQWEFDAESFRSAVESVG